MDEIQSEKRIASDKIGQYVQQQKEAGYDEFGQTTTDRYLDFATGLPDMLPDFIKRFGDPLGVQGRGKAVTSDYLQNPKSDFSTANLEDIQKFALEYMNVAAPDAE